MSIHNEADPTPSSTRRLADSKSPGIKSQKTDPTTTGKKKMANKDRELFEILRKKKHNITALDLNLKSSNKEIENTKQRTLSKFMVKPTTRTGSVFMNEFWSTKYYQHVLRNSDLDRYRYDLAKENMKPFMEKLKKFEKTFEKTYKDQLYEKDTLKKISYLVSPKGSPGSRPEIKNPINKALSGENMGGNEVISLPSSPTTVRVNSTITSPVVKETSSRRVVKFFPLKLSERNSPEISPDPIRPNTKNMENDPLEWLGNFRKAKKEGGKIQLKNHLTALIETCDSIHDQNLDFKKKIESHQQDRMIEAFHKKEETRRRLERQLEALRKYTHHKTKSTLQLTLISRS
eukprot:TRINITY_DN10219_c0_g3_i8.p1 TRINITY_DN10219_c0_g3~~TRINITY_DN10219_c0_g3_i8.p1  ORF type:complete len:346 (+),score=38.05 TRINITY_DN10219_c0_g3_i8:118-1155(+)